jgi:hypothetical protein
MTAALVRVSMSAPEFLTYLGGAAVVGFAIGIIIATWSKK